MAPHMIYLVNARYYVFTRSVATGTLLSTSHILMYWDVSWASKNAEQDMLEREEMRKLRWMLGIKRN